MAINYPYSYNYAERTIENSCNANHINAEENDNILVHKVILLAQPTYIFSPKCFRLA